MKIGCVVLNYNDYITTERFLNRAKEMESIFHIVVVDNCSTDGSFSILKRYSNTNISVVKTKKNGGYGYGNNIGIEYLKKRFDDLTGILIANPDVEFEENIITEMHHYLSNDVAIVAPLTLTPDNTPQLPIAWKVPIISDYFIFSSILLNKILKPMWYKKKYFNNNVCEVGCVQGSLFLLNPSSFEGSLYDENIFLFFEESCIGKYFKDNGYRTLLLTRVQYIHNHSVSINKTISSEVKKRKITLDSFYQFYIDYYRLPKAIKMIFYVYKKIIYIENSILLTIFYDLKKR